MRRLGDEYVRSEFRLHKSAKPEFLSSFFGAWEDYLAMISKQHAGQLGADLDEASRAKLSEAQKKKLDELKVEAIKAASATASPSSAASDAHIGAGQG